jgi:hypothetical protein
MHLRMGFRHAHNAFHMTDCNRNTSAFGTFLTQLHIQAGNFFFVKGVTVFKNGVAILTSVLNVLSKQLLRNNVWSLVLFGGLGVKFFLEPVAATGIARMCDDVTNRANRSSATGST